ncbi:aldehyde dehydrogenase family protein [Actinomadura vinacea]|uniref:aldehyde dehydrogenase (NAD(+)) n=1 Tax=Actinomadura vinacea TaxID=115336 RepID=A0ABP5VHY3_9ACTN
MSRAAAVRADLRLLIDGQAVRGEGEPLHVVNPATEDECAVVAGASPEQVAAAVEAAAAAFGEGPWGSPEERAGALERLADGIERRHRELVEAIVTEVGSPVALAESLQVAVPAAHLRHYAKLALEDRTERLPPDPGPPGSASIVAYRPVGVVAAIAAYNYPLLLAVHKLGAALAAGCTAVLLPSPRTPIATLLFGEAVRAAGLPAGVVNVLAGGAEAARALTEHPRVDKIAFTGSEAVGTQVMRQAAAGTRGVVLELGGKSAALIAPDADLAAVVPGIHFRYARNGGQACAAPTRLLVPESAWDDFAAISEAAYRDLRVGDPWSADVTVGPMISAAHRDRVERFVADAVAGGARIIAGGGRPPVERGWFTNPVLLAGAAPGSPVAQEEIFGPVAVAFPYRDLDEAVALANGTRYGLHAYVYTADTESGVALAARLRSGSVSVNGGGAFRPDAPMGGFGASGVGRELGRWGVHEYLEPQHVQWAR